jgi:hypothetical protein
MAPARLIAGKPRRLFRRLGGSGHEAPDVRGKPPALEFRDGYFK